MKKGKVWTLLITGIICAALAALWWHHTLLSQTAKIEPDTPPATLPEMAPSPISTNTNSTSISTSSVSSDTGASPATTLTVNNQSVPVPANGTVHKEINTSNGTTTIDVSNSSTGSTGSSSSSSLNVDLHSSSVSDQDP